MLPTGSMLSDTFSWKKRQHTSKIFPASLIVDAERSEPGMVTVEHGVVAK